jgi:hypothetical protein
MKRIIDIDEDYFEIIKHDVKNNGSDYKTFVLVANSVPYEERPQGEWIRKEDVIHSIAKQYSEHNELVPIWLSIADMRGDKE